MEEHSRFHNMSDLEDIMINILNEGDKKVWESIQEIKNPLERCKNRKLFWVAIKKIKTK